MTKKRFAELFLKEAKKNGATITKKGNIKCPNGKNISIKKLEAIFGLEGKKCVSAQSKILKQSGIQPCCFIHFRYIGEIVLKKY